MLLASISFQEGVNGYNGTVDTLTSADAPKADNSDATSLNVDGNPQFQGLLRFEDIIGSGAGKIPVGSTILGATLELEVWSGGNPIALHRMLRHWSDADTWDSLRDGVQTDGVEARVSPDATTESVPTGLLQIDVTSSVQSWANDPSGNRGWTLMPTGSNGVDFHSAEGAIPPRLVVSYELDSRPLITITATDETALEEGLDGGVFTITRSNVAAGDVVVAYHISGTATMGTDYSSVTGSITIPEGAESVDVVITPIDDNDAEGGETVIVTVLGSDAYYVGSSSTDTVTIADDDAAISLTFQASTISEQAGLTTATVSRNTRTTAPLVVTLQGADVTEATLPASVTIPAGQTSSEPFSIHSVNDRLVDGDQTMVITAQAVGHRDDHVALVVADDDVAGNESCFAHPGPLVSYSGPQPKLEIDDVQPNTTFDASAASWYATSKTRIEVEDGVNVCWHGGLVEHNWPADQDWDTTHGDHGFKFINTPNLVVENVQIRNAGDGISLYEGTEDFLIRGTYFEDIRDDAIEHDWLGNGIIEDTFINGAYVAFAARSRDSVDIDGSDNTWVIKNSLTFLRPQIGVYKGPSPGYGRFFKWEDVAPKLEIHNSIFRADELPRHDYLGIPEGKLVSSSNNIVVWSGEGDVPPLPHGFTLTEDMSVWDNAVRQWKIDHGFPIEPVENDPPVLATIGDKTVDEGSLLAFTASATDGSVPASELTFSLDGGAPDGATIDPNTGQFRWTPPMGTSPGSYQVTVRVTDDGVPRLTDFETITILVNDINLPPVLAPIGSQSAAEGRLVTLTASATDPDLPANDLTFSLDAGAPSGATIDPTSGEFRWTPGEDDGGAVFSVTVRVTDNQTPSLEDFQSFTIAVDEVNQAPELANIGSKTVDEGSLLTFTASASDADVPSSGLIYSLDSNAPAGATIDPSTGQFRWTPPGGTSPGNHTVTIRVRDNGVPRLDDSETITITVNDVNLPPVLTPIGNLTVAEGSPLEFTAVAIDDDLPANHLTYSLDPGAPASATIDPLTGRFSWTPGEAHGAAVFTVTVRVTDDQTPSLQDSETFDIFVDDVNQAPLLAPIGNRNANEGSLLAFTAWAVDGDFPLDTLTYSLDPGAPEGATIDPNTGHFRWRPDEADGPGVYPITVRVSDDGAPSLSDFETIVVSIGEVGEAPVLAEIGAKSVEEGNLLTFTASASDVDLPANTLTFSLDAGAPAGATIDPITGQFRWMPDEADGPGVYPVTIRVVEDRTPNREDFETFHISVGEVNLAPVLTSIGARSVNEGSLLTFTATATDDDLPRNKLRFSLDPGAPSGATIDPNTGEFRWTPPEGISPGNHTVTVRVTDNRVPGLDDFETLTITVSDINLPPVLATIGTQTVEEGSPLTFIASATDADLPKNDLTFSLDSGAPLSATIDPVTGEFGWTPGEAHGSAVFSVTVRVTDNQTPSRDDFETFDIRVVEVNQAPVIGEIADKAVSEGRLLTFTAVATDADVPANRLSFSLDPDAPAGATIDPTTGQFRWIPDETHGPGVYSVNVRVTDDGSPALDDVETLNITVGEINQAPILAELGNQHVEEGRLLSFSAAATDADLPANHLTFSLDAGAPPGATIDPSTGLFRWIPGEADGPAVHTVTIRVVDDGIPSRQDFETIEISVGELNRAPILAEIGDQRIDEGSLLTFSAFATDADLPANNLTFSLDPGAPAGAAIDPNTGQFRWTPPGGTSPGLHTVTVRVTDDGVPSLHDFETLSITVNDVNLPPVLAAIGPQTVEEGSTLTFTASATDADLPANDLTYSLANGAPLSATIDPHTGEFRWTPGEAHGGAVFSVTVRVTDNQTPSLQDFKSFDIAVVDVNEAPLLAPIGNKTVDEGNRLSFTARATDHDLPANSLSFSLDPGAPVGATIHPTTGQFQWTPPEGTSPGTHTITVRVTDDGLPQRSSFETLKITVNDINLPPKLAPIGSLTVEEGELLRFTAMATDGDLPADHLTYRLEPGAPLSASIHPVTGEFSWTPGEAHGSAVFSITIRVTDNQSPSLVDFETFDITVVDTNQAPVLAPIGSRSITEGEPLAFTAWAVDGDLPADNLTYSLDAGAPVGATIDPRTGQFRWTPPAGISAGQHQVTIRVTDDGEPNLDVFDTFNITVFRSPSARHPLDVNRDQAVTVLDALAIINQINRTLSDDRESIAGNADPTGNDFDTNRDGNVSALDALLVINHISIHHSEAVPIVAVPASTASISKSAGALDDDLILILAQDRIVAGLGRIDTQR